MLFKQSDLDRIKSGEISLAFRRWKRPSVKKGSLINTAIGRIEILDVLKMALENISERDAQQAGFTTKQELQDQLNKQKEGHYYKIQIKYHSPDPRISLRSVQMLNDEEFFILKNRLTRLDQNSNVGPWTHQVLEIIKIYPERRAGDLAEMLKLEKDWLKIHIRKLKNLGLTISHKVGYRISPLGHHILDRKNQ
jgi:predicted transcriptional regulator